MSGTRSAASILVPLLLLSAACGRVGPPVRASRAPAAREVVIPGGEAAPTAAEEDEEVKR